MSLCNVEICFRSSCRVGRSPRHNNLRKPIAIANNG